MFRRRTVASAPKRDATVETPPTTPIAPIAPYETADLVVPSKAARQQAPPPQQPAGPLDDPNRMSNGTVVAGRFRLEKTIGKGSYGKVKLATDLLDNTKVAVKFIARSSIKKPAHSVRIKREINLMTALHHENIAGLYMTLETDADIILIMEYVNGADLYERIVGHRQQRFSESEARRLFVQVVAAIEYCHDNRVIHRDLKPENVMVDANNQVKLIDFGFANMYHPRGFLETNCGSPLYAAPEIVRGVRYVGPEVDSWSLGVILYAMITGMLPFEDEQLKGLYAKICAGSYSIPSHVSGGAKDLIRGMLKTNAYERMTISQVARHPWLHNFESVPIPRSLTKQTRRLVSNPSEEILQQMVSFGFSDIVSTRLVIRTDPDDPATAIYHLLQERHARMEASTHHGGDGDVDAMTDDMVSVMITPPATPMKRDSICDEGILGALKRDEQRVQSGNSGLPSSHQGAGARWERPRPYGCGEGGDLAAPIIMAPPMQMHTPLMIKLPSHALSTGYSGPLVSGHEEQQQQPSSSSTLFSAPGSIVSQAAATVANHFRKLRGISILSKSEISGAAPPMSMTPPAATGGSPAVPPHPQIQHIQQQYRRQSSPNSNVINATSRLHTFTNGTNNV